MRYELNKVNGRDNLHMCLLVCGKFVLPVSCFYVSNTSLATRLILQCCLIFLQALCHYFCLAQAFILLFSHLCAACILLLSMSEGGSSEASASDTKSVTLGMDDLRKLIKETVCEELTTEKSSVSSILKSRSKGSFNYSEVSASMPSPEHQYCYIIWYIWPNFNMAKTRGPSCHSGRGAAVVVWIRSAWMARGGCYSQQVSPESCELLPTQATSCSPSGLPLSRPPHRPTIPCPHSRAVLFTSQRSRSSHSPVAHRISSQCPLPSELVPCPLFLLFPLPKPLPSPVLPKFSLLLSLFFILVLFLSLNWSWSLFPIPLQALPFPPVLSSRSLFKFQFLLSLLSSSPYFSILVLLLI